MISVVIPTYEAEHSLAATLSALVPGVVAGLIREVIIVDGGSRDRTLKIADTAGATILTVDRGRGQQLAAGAEAARGDWLLFLHADTVLERGWEDEVGAYIERCETGARPERAAAFRFALDDIGFMPRVIEFGVLLRCTLFRLPYGDQGLLIPRRVYQSRGGYQAMPLMEDVELIGRLGRAKPVILRTRAVTSAARYHRDGYFLRASRNIACLGMYYLRVPNRFIARIYG
ncbi:MAG: TIGR04283 family arsenosugar biosynthesis glycosyltransferase [Pseudomonadota bacterium]